MPPANPHRVNVKTPTMCKIFQSSHLGSWCKAFKEFGDRVKSGKTRASTIGLLPPPPSVKGPTPTPMIVVDG